MRLYSIAGLYKETPELGLFVCVLMCLLCTHLYVGQLKACIIKNSFRFLYSWRSVSFRYAWYRISNCHASKMEANFSKSDPGSSQLYCQEFVVDFLFFPHVFNRYKPKHNMLVNTYTDKKQAKWTTFSAFRFLRIDRGDVWPPVPLEAPLRDLATPRGGSFPRRSLSLPGGRAQFRISFRYRYCGTTRCPLMESSRKWLQTTWNFPSPTSRGEKKKRIPY